MWRPLAPKSRTWTDHMHRNARRRWKTTVMPVLRVLNARKFNPSTTSSGYMILCQPMGFMKAHAGCLSVSRLSIALAPEVHGLLCTNMSCPFFLVWGM